MKSYRKELWFNIPSRRGFVNITSEVEVAVRESGIREGLVLPNHKHITAPTDCRQDERFWTVQMCKQQGDNVFAEIQIKLFGFVV